MARRSKILIICKNIDKTRDEYLEWCGVLKEHLDEKAKCYNAERRIETPFTIIDFVWSQPVSTGNYKVFRCGENEETILKMATGTG